MKSNLLIVCKVIQTDIFLWPVDCSSLVLFCKIPIEIHYTDINNGFPLKQVSLHNNLTYFMALTTVCWSLDISVYHANTKS